MDLLHECNIDGNLQDFAAAIHILVSKPNAVNKRLVGAEIQNVTSFTTNKLACSYNSFTTKEFVNSILVEHRKNWMEVKNRTYPEQLSPQILLPQLEVGSNCLITRKCVTRKRSENLVQPNKNVIENTDIKRDDVLWKYANLNDLQEIQSAFFMPHSPNDPCYAIVYTSEIETDSANKSMANKPNSVHKIGIWLENLHSLPKSHSKWKRWLEQKCFKSVEKWCNAKIGGETNYSKSKSESTIQPPPSLRLVSLEEYDTLYTQIKAKYVKPLLESNAWGTESTDPDKFIHEDVGIAVYLMLLWKNSSKNPIKFADIGCGNGLLVYILTQEGFGQGVGFDLRERKIWDTLRNLGKNSGTSIDLRTATILPDEDNLSQFNDFDWLIGNHSDELTPWLPLLARKSSAKLFLLPCCLFDFYGKYQRRAVKSKAFTKSSYREYLDYVCSIGENCGFKMEEDRLKIPSTKRICFVARHDNLGNEKTKLKDELSQLDSHMKFPNGCVDTNIEQMLNKAKNTSGKAQFLARLTTEKVRNCTKISKQDVIEPIINVVVNKLLEMEDWTLKAQPKYVVPELSEKRRKIDLLTQSLNHEANYLSIERENVPTNSPAFDKWNAGGCININELPLLIGPSLLSEIKSECGGLQTLLRNHNYIFIVQSGTVRLRCPLYDKISDGKRKKSKNSHNSDVRQFRKTKICWLFENHPQGCPVMTSECVWAHGLTDLKEKC